ncbi:MAG: cation:proton antiporter [Clostridia bacterium]|nr:cation:proton antiporter [Clostridia bacterium]
MFSLSINSEVTILLQLAIALMAGLLMSRIAKLIHLPAVTAYLAAGILIGPSVLGLLFEHIGVSGVFFNTAENVSHYKIICDAALGFIAFSIGNEFRVSELRHVGRQAIVVSICEALTATILVDTVLLLCRALFWPDLPLYVCLVLGAIAAATAPAATLMVVRQYKAEGPVTRILLPVVALDDAIGLIIFAVSFGVASTMETGHLDVLAMVLNPILEILLSLLLGALMGFLFSWCERLFESRSKRLAISVTFVLLTVAFSMVSIPVGRVTVSFSPLLVCMMLGTVFCNVCDFSEELMQRCERWATPVLVLFFVLSGAELDFSVFASGVVILLGLIYIFTRSTGKMLGAGLGSSLMKCDPSVRRYLGVTLLPQAGVALGMSLQAKALGSGDLIRNITLMGVLIYELFGPLMTRLALLKAGEIKPENRTSSRGKAV